KPLLLQAAEVLRRRLGTRPLDDVGDRAVAVLAEGSVDDRRPEGDFLVAEGLSRRRVRDRLAQVDAVELEALLDAHRGAGVQVELAVAGLRDAAGPRLLADLADDVVDELHDGGAERVAGDRLVVA